MVITGNYPPKKIRKKSKFKWSDHSHLKKKKVNKAMVEGQRCLSDF